MKAKLKDLTFGIGKTQFITFSTNEDFRPLYDDLKDCELELTVKKWRAKRSLDANAFMWQLCTLIADKVSETKENVYRRNIREGCEYTPLPIKSECTPEFCQLWAHHGIGWFAEVVDDSKIEGYKLVFAYHGSSTYDTKQMSALIERVVQDAEAVGIEVISERERSLLIEDWSKKCQKA